MSRPDDPLVAGGLTIPAEELRWRFGPAGGPGGQHANRSATRAELTIDLANCKSIPPERRDHLLRRLGSRAVDGRVTMIADESRSQWRNRVIARRRMAHLIADALRPEPAPRRPTMPTRASRLRRLAAKRHRATVKRLRRTPPTEE